MVHAISYIWKFCFVAILVNMKPLLALHCVLHHGSACISMLFLCAITIFLFNFFIVRSPKATNKSPPSPPRLPLIGNLHQLGKYAHRSLQALSSKHGPLMLMQIGCVPTIIVSSAEMAYEVLKTHDLIFASRPRMSMAKMLLYDHDVAFSPYGEYWRQVRKVSVVHLLNIKVVLSFQAIREEEVSLMVCKIRSSPRNLVNLSKLIIALTSDIICRVALGRKYYEGEGGASKALHMLREFTELLGTIPIGDFIPWLGWLDNLSGLSSRVRKNAEELDDFLERVLEEHRQARRAAGTNHVVDNDFVDMLFSLNEDGSSGISLGADNIKAVILDMFGAGTHTTFTVLEWAMAELIKNPGTMNRVQEEIRGIVGHKREIKDEDINKMIYLKSVNKETLRLHTPLPLLVPRETIKDIELKGFHIPMGTRVVVNAWAIGRDPSSWERPEEFLPDRFVNNNVNFKGKDFQLIPFGAGRRSCPGIDFAISTIEPALVHLLHHFDWELPKGMEGEVLDMSETQGLTASKKSGLVLIAKPRAI